MKLRLNEIFSSLLGATPMLLEVFPFVEPPDTVAHVSTQVVA